MTLKELEQLAGQRAPMPAGLNAAEQLAFLSMRNLYIQHALEMLDVEQAKTEKTKIIHEYNDNMLKLKSWESAHEKEKKLATLTPLLKESGCLTCRQFFYTLSGYKQISEVQEEMKNESSENL